MSFVLALYLWISKSQSHGGSGENLTTKYIFESATPLWVVVAMNLSVQWGSQLVAGIFISPEDLALLSVAQRIANLVSFVLIALNLVVSPKFSALNVEKSIVI
ncbi:hypothetical protein [Aliamphritea spongicola]|nr:hypothetical protein [Aliamphritea spongicola]